MKQLKQVGKMKDFNQIKCPLKMHQLLPLAQDGHLLSIQNFKSLLGLEDLKEKI